MMLVTTLGFGGSFAAFTCITPMFVGNLAGGRLISRFGWQRTLRGMRILLTLT